MLKKPTGRTVIVDIEGLIDHVNRIAQSAAHGYLDMGEQVIAAIREHTITEGTCE
jgi:hypothetical protein